MVEPQVLQTTEQEDQWAVVELMGHAQTQGRITMGEFGGLLRVDVPDDEVDGGYRTEFYSMSAIYSVKLVSEEIARAYSKPTHSVISYDTPIVTREQHETALRQVRDENWKLREELHELERRLTAVDALPAPAESNIDF